MRYKASRTSLLNSVWFYFLQFGTFHKINKLICMEKGWEEK